MLLNLASFIAGVLAKLSFERIEYLLKNKNTILRKKLQEVFDIPKDNELCVEWQKFYSDHFKITADFFGVEIPEKPSKGSWKLIFIPVGLTMNSVLAVMQIKFIVWTYAEDLDVSIPTNTRTSAQSYAVWVRIGDEPDEEYLGQSTDQADPYGKIGMTLLERLVFEVKFFVETGNHPDYKGVTFCTGSRYSDGGVPGMCWGSGSGKVGVSWYDVDCSHPSCGLRQAVSL